MKVRHWILAAFVLFLAAQRPARATVYNFPSDAIPDVLAPGDVLNISSMPPTGVITTAAGSTVNLMSGGSYYSVNGSGALNANPGSLGVASLDLVGGIANLRGGVLGFSGNFVDGSHVDIDGAQILTAVRLRNSTGVFRSGALRSVNISEEGRFTIMGSGAAGYFQVIDGELNITGGGIAALPGAMVLEVLDRLNLFVRSAAINGAPVAGLQFGLPITIADRDVDLSVVLADGTPYVLPLTRPINGAPGRYTFYNGSTVTVTQVPEPSHMGLFAVAGMAHVRRRVGRRRRPAIARGT